MSESKTKAADLTALELARIANLKEAAHLSSLSTFVLRTQHRDKLVALGPRRLGMRVRDALMLDANAKNIA